MPKHKHFDPETRTKIITRMTELRESGKNFNEVANTLNAERVFTSAGKKWTANNIQMFYYNSIKKLEAYRGAPIATVTRNKIVAAGSISKALILAVINEPTLTDRQKVEGIRGLINT